MDNEKWETFCNALRNRLDCLCEHNATKMEVYEDLKEEVRWLIKES
jgi:hypothetical protein